MSKTSSTNTPTSTSEIRQAFLDYFSDQGHEIVASSPLVPHNDPTLLFTNAGMVQFKDVFTGKEKRSNNRAVSSQRCVRAGGKHNDLENVGYTARHHTFFEMLGNFSFGDYFKHEAIAFAWEFLTKTLNLPEEKLWVTVYTEDDEAAEIWQKEIGVSPDRMSRCGEKDNFWSMGPTGPCGPSTEIFYDHGPDITGGPPGSPDEDGDRYIEIWNLVFTQFDRDIDGNLNPLPKPSVDTGMGLERVAAIMQGEHNNYDIDLFQNLIKAVRDLAKCAEDEELMSQRVVADHIRSCAFIITDGVVPSNEGRGYVLRRIIRRAIRHGSKFGLNDTFFYKLVAPLVAEMGEAYPELVKAQANIEKVLKQEEERFAETLQQGLKILEQSLTEIKDKTIPGEVVFQLYDTFGFPVDLTADIARERGLALDHDGFDQAMEQQKERARAAGQFAAGAQAHVGELDLSPIDAEFNFTGYQTLDEDAVIKAIFLDGQQVDQINAGDTAVLLLDHTPFYAESGGQTGDIGLIKSSNGLFNIENTRKQNDVHLHTGTVKIGSLKVGEKAQASVSKNTRRATERNHSATHLLHAALRQVLGEHVLQKGSLVTADRLRFDFSHSEPVNPDQQKEIEQLVNTQIISNRSVKTKIMSMKKAQESGAMALFGEKYDDEVRVLSMGKFSIELCGGTHVNRTGDIGLFKLVSETGTASGIRRIEALTGEGALKYIGETEKNLVQIASLLKATPANIEEKVQQLLQRNRQQEKDLQALKGKLASQSGSDLTENAVEINGIKVVAAKLEDADVNTLRETMDQLKNKLGTAAIVLASVEGDKVKLVAGVTKDATDKIQAGKLISFVAQQIDGKGGGRPDMAQAGGNDPSKLDDALESVTDWVKQKLG